MPPRAVPPGRLGRAALLAAVVCASGGCAGARRAPDGPPAPTRVEVLLEAEPMTRPDAAGVEVTVRVADPGAGGPRPFAWTVRVEPAAGPVAEVSGVDSLRSATGSATWRVWAPVGRAGARVAVTVLPDAGDERVTRTASVPPAEPDAWGGVVLDVREPGPAPAAAWRGELPAGRPLVARLAAPDGAPVTVRLRALRTDSLPPSLASAPAPWPAETGAVVVSETVSPDQARRGVPLPALQPGAYRLDADGGPSRVLVVRPPDHPQLTRLGDLLGPLDYLADASERRALRAAVRPTVQRRVFDALWGRYLTDRRRAAAVVRDFYARAEEANRRFSDAQPGWRTDRGMVLILLGEPDAVEATDDGERWTYRRAAAGTLAFRRSPSPLDGLPDAWRLARDERVVDALRRAQRDWRHGRIP